MSETTTISFGNQLFRVQARVLTGICARRSSRLDAMSWLWLSLSLLQSYGAVVRRSFSRDTEYIL